MIMQQIYIDFMHGVEMLFQKKNPFWPPVIDYGINDVKEIWENPKSIDWIQRSIREKNLRDPKFLPLVYRQYQRELKECALYWKKGYINNIVELQRVVRLLEKAVVGFGILYYSALDEKTPAKGRRLALQFRREDRFFDEADKFLGKSLRFVFPTLRGYETYILKNELKKLPSVTSLKRRSKGFVYVPGQKVIVSTLEEFAKKSKKFAFDFPKLSAQSSELRGQTAFAGKARGRVRILLRKDQMSSMKKNEVLVATMTTPDFVPAMRKAAAIVTDEGGITCHAAIFAREMKKPCVIGTKIATKVLKDGDMVEVDTEKGIVRKIIEKRV